MTPSRLLRLSGMAAMAGGFFIILARVNQVVLFGSAPLSTQAFGEGK